MKKPVRSRVRKGKSKTRVADYLPLIQQSFYRGKPIRNLDHSLYAVGNDSLLIQATKPDADHFFFGINAELIRKASEVMLICVRSDDGLIVFRIPSAELLACKMNMDPERMRYLPTVKYDRKRRKWCLTLKKTEAGSTLDIDRYRLRA